MTAGRLGFAELTYMHALIETHRAELLALASRRGVTDVRVFGSMSRGDGNTESDSDSDVDLLVTLAPGTSALALGGLLLDAQGVDLGAVWLVVEQDLPGLGEAINRMAAQLGPQG